MREHVGLGRAHLGGEPFDMRKHDLLMLQGDGAELLLILVVLADRVDEGAAVKALFALPIPLRASAPAI